MINVIYDVNRIMNYAIDCITQNLFFELTIVEINHFVIKQPI